MSRRRLRPPTEGVLGVTGLTVLAGLRGGAVGTREGLLSLPVRSFIDGVTGLVDWWKSGEGIASSGGLISSWTGAVNGEILTSSGVARPTLDTVDTLSSPHWLVSGNAQHLDLIGWNPPNFDHCITMTVVTDAVASAGYSSSVDGVAIQNANFIDAGSWFYCWIPYGVSKLSPEPAIPGVGFFSTRAVLTYVCGRTYAALWRNGVKIMEASYAAAAVTTPDDFYLGWLYGLGGAYDFSGIMHDAVLINGIPSDGDISGIHTQLMALRGV